MSVVDFDTDSEGDATFGKYLQSDSLKKEERPVQAACPQPCEQQPNLDEEGGRVQGGVQDVSGEESDVLSEEVEILAGEEQEVLAFKEESNHGAEDEEVCLEMRTPAFPDRLTCYFSLSHYHMTMYAYHYVSRWKTL